MNGRNEMSVDEILMRVSGRTLQLIANGILAKGHAVTREQAWKMACAARPELVTNYRPTFESVREIFKGTVAGAKSARNIGELVEAVVRHRMNESPKADYSATYKGVMRDYPSLAQVYSGFEGPCAS